MADEIIFFTTNSGSYYHDFFAKKDYGIKKICMCKNCNGSIVSLYF